LVKTSSCWMRFSISKSLTHKTNLKLQTIWANMLELFRKHTKIANLITSGDVWTQIIHLTFQRTKSIKCSWSRNKLKFGESWIKRNIRLHGSIAQLNKKYTWNSTLTMKIQTYEVCTDRHFVCVLLTFWLLKKNSGCLTQWIC